MKQYTYLYHRIFLTLFISLAATFSAFGVKINFEKSTPVGSWQIRQEMMTDEKGRQTMQEIKTSLLGEEKREGKDHYWMELVIQNHNVRKGKVSKTGDRSIVKVLVEADVLNGDLSKVINNLTGFGKEIIMQTGDADPMKIEQGGMMGSMLMQAMGIKVDYDFEETGSETVNVEGGKFKTRVIEGSGSVQSKIMFQTINVQSETKQWVSEEVPFGMVKSESRIDTNGEITTSTAQLMEYGKSGAFSEIKGEPQSLQIPNLQGLFGG